MILPGIEAPEIPNSRVKRFCARAAVGSNALIAAGLVDIPCDRSVQLLVGIRRDGKTTIDTVMAREGRDIRILADPAGPYWTPPIPAAADRARGDALNIVRPLGDSLGAALEVLGTVTRHRVPSSGRLRRSMHLKVLPNSNGTVIQVEHGPFDELGIFPASTAEAELLAHLQLPTISTPLDDFRKVEEVIGILPIQEWEDVISALRRILLPTGS